MKNKVKDLLWDIFFEAVNVIVGFCLLAVIAVLLYGLFLFLKEWTLIAIGTLIVSWALGRIITGT